MFHQVLVMWLHLIAAVVWVGGMAFLAFVLGPYGRRLPDDRRSKLFQDVGKRFSRISWFLIFILIITGPLNLMLRGFSPFAMFDDAFISTSYGQAVLVKTVLFIIVIVLSAVHDFVVGPQVHRLLLSLPERPEDEKENIRRRAHALRRIASYIGRVNFTLALVILLFAARLAV